MSAYIKGTGNVSPQMTFNGDIFTTGILPFSGNRLVAKEPDYSAYIDAKQIRRMSRVIKMGVVAAKLALADTGKETPDGVIVGTALGCIEDTDSFLKKLVLNKEEMLNPTAFIHSTHNTIAAQIALVFQCRGYNSTYVHKTLSFESALLDAVMLLEEKALENILVGGIDELTDTSFRILNRLGSYKKETGVGSHNLYQLATKGSVAGEGSAFFALTNKKDPTCFAEVKEVITCSFTRTEDAIRRIKDVLAEKNITPGILITGHNGDVQNDLNCNEVVKGLNIPIALRYKHLCGEYATASSFGAWMAAQILKQKRIPQAFTYGIDIKDTPGHILVYNQNDFHHAFILLSAC